MTRLQLWLDFEPRLGPAAMAVDEWLLSSVTDTPILRVYRWLGDWGTIGYFGALSEARRSLPGLEWVRRWTGGGTVDHRADWTYTLALPSAHPVATMKGAQSYSWIHGALARALAPEGIGCRLSSGDMISGSSLCFRNPVENDLVSFSGCKLAGAGQRRSREGFLHQGSVAGSCSSDASVARAHRLAGELAVEWHPSALEPPAEIIAGLVTKRYGNPVWNDRR